MCICVHAGGMDIFSKLSYVALHIVIRCIWNKKEVKQDKWGVWDGCGDGNLNWVFWVGLNDRCWSHEAQGKLF